MRLVLLVCELEEESNKTTAHRTPSTERMKSRPTWASKTKDDMRVARSMETATINSRKMLLACCKGKQQKQKPGGEKKSTSMGLLALDSCSCS